MSGDLSARIANLSPEKRALLAERLKKPQALATPETEPIAIVGIGCRFPGANGPDAFWDLVRNGVDAIREVPADRWDIDALYDPDPSASGMMMSRWGGFLDRIDGFDASFFGISPREASQMDPQQRLLLEVAWEAFEHAGQTREALKGSRTGVFVGVHSQSADYTLLQYADIERMDAFTGTGTAHNFLSGRLSYLFDLHGPSLVVDTACSSSLVAVHLACQSLRLGESAMAVAGGVNLMVTPHFTVAASRMRLLSPDGRCRTFDERANGYVRGEGCGVVVLKRLADARADGDRIIAVIRGSAVNQDGRTNGITAPNGLSQRAAIREALRAGGVAPSRVSYVETHGTGTALGDPIEVESIAAELGQPVEGAPICALGSTKANIGHLEGAAGVAGLIRAALCLQHREIPPVVHFTRLNPHINLSNTRLEVPSARRAWPATAEPRVAGVSSFGWCGTNAHAVLEEAPAAAVADTKPSAAAPVLFPLSAGDAEALKALALRYADAIESGGHPLASVLRSAALKRSHLEHRLAIVAETREELIERLRAWGTGEGHPQASVRRAAAEPGGIVFVFPGQGSQWLGMGRQLAASEPVFRQALEQCDRAIAAVVGWSVIEELHADGDRSRLSQIDVVQPTLFAVSVALAALWRSWGIEPDAVVGHSMGEIAAAHVAGALTIDDAARIICLRSRLLRTVSGKGAMAVVELSMADTATALEGFEDRLSIAVSNSRRSTVVSGDPVALELFMARQREADVFCRPVKVDVASHSPQMDPLRAPLLDALSGIAPVTARIPVYSTVLDGVARGEELVDTYWVRNLREPVVFASSVERLIADGHLNFVEVSAHPILLPAIETALQESSAEAGLVVASVRRDESERANLLMSLGRLYANGCAVRWDAVTPPAPFEPGPMYPWQHERFWIEPEDESRAGARIPGKAGADHPVLGASIDIASSPSARLWLPSLDARRHAFLYEHSLNGQPVLAASTSIELLMAAARQCAGGPVVLRDVVFERPLVLTSAEVQVIVEAGESGTWKGSVFGRTRGGDPAWVRHATARAEVASEAAAPEPARLPSPTREAGDAFYRRLVESGVDIGPSLKVVSHLDFSVEGCDAALDARPGRKGRGWALDPWLLDGAFQSAAAVSGAATLRMPARLALVRASIATGPSVLSVRVRRTVGAVVYADVVLNDAHTGLRIDLEDIELHPLETSAARASAADRLHVVQWTEAPRGSRGGIQPPTRHGAWLLCGDGSRLEHLVAEQLGHKGERVHCLKPSELASLGALLDGMTTGAQEELRGVVLMPAASASSPAAVASQSCDTMTVLARELARRDWTKPPRLTVLTAGVPLGLPPASVNGLAGAALWGLGRVVAEEHREFWGGLVDIDPSETDANAALQVVAELLDPDQFDQAAYRGGIRYVPKLQPLGSTAGSAFAFRTNGLYVVTGGLGDVGMVVARWAVEQGARHLVLMGRRGAAGSDARVAELRALGCTTEAVAVDVADAASLAAWRESARATGPFAGLPVRGVFHCAGVVDDRLVRDLDEASLARVMRPKVLGGWTLHRVFEQEPLDAFVLFSSVGALLGQAGQASYAAANAFLDGLAHARRAQGKTALSINWGVWRELGFAASGGGRRTVEALEAGGIRSLEPHEGVTSLATLLASGAAQAAVVPVDWARFATANPTVADRPFLSDRSAAARTAPASTGGAPDFVSDLAAMPGEERRARLEAHLQQQLAAVLKVPVARIDRLKPLGTLGLESLLALELRNRLERSIGLRLSATMVWNHPTVQALATYVAGRLSLSLDKDPAVAAAPVAVDKGAAVASNLSDDDALKALMEGRS